MVLRQDGMVIHGVKGSTVAIQRLLEAKLPKHYTVRVHNSNTVIITKYNEPIEYKVYWDLDSSKLNVVIHGFFLQSCESSDPDLVDKIAPLIIGGGECYNARARDTIMLVVKKALSKYPALSIGSHAHDPRTGEQPYLVIKVDDSQEFLNLVFEDCIRIVRDRRVIGTVPYSKADITSVILQAVRSEFGIREILTQEELLRRANSTICLVEKSLLQECQSASEDTECQSTKNGPSPTS
jgi:hypothetical protein